MSEPRGLDALRVVGQVALRLTRQTTSGRLALGHLHGAVDPEALPPEVREAIVRELQAAADAVEPLSAKAVESTLKEAWGRPPGRVLDELEPAPVAVTPSSQVHRAEHDGRAVAIKVLRPGLAEVVRSDLGALGALGGPLGGALPRSDVGALIAEARERVLDELDLEHEASVQRGFARATRRVDGLTVPAVVSDLSHERVLVHDWVEGTTLAAGLPPEPGVTARGMVRFFVGAARSGLVHADPHPANVLVTAEGLAVVDFGASARVDAARVALAGDAVRAVVEDDPDAFAAALGALGWSAADDARVGHAIARELLAPFLDGPAVLDAAALLALGERALDHVAELAGLAARTALPREDLWPLRMVGGLVGTLARLGAEEDWPRLLLAAIEHGWEG